MTRAPRLRAALIAGLCVAWSGRAHAAESFEYLYVEANTGAASGGHAAIRFGNDVYHFQHDGGIVRAVRERWERFDYAYRGVHNRSIHATRVAVSEDTHAMLTEAFRRRHLVEEAQIELVESAGRDDAFLALLARLPRAQRRGDGDFVDTGLRLRGGGYFVATAAPAGAQPPPWLRDAAARMVDRVTRRMRAERGAGYLERRARLIDRDTSRLRYECRPRQQLDADRLPDRHIGYADAYARSTLARMAVDVLSGRRVPAVQAFRSTEHPALRLSARELDAMREAADRLTAAIVRLTASERGDWGFAVLVAAARLVAAEASLASGTLVVPDVYAGDARTVATAHIAGDFAAALLREARSELDLARAGAFFGRGRDEAAWSRLETAANLLLELETAVATGAPMRVMPDPPLPSREPAAEERVAVPPFAAGEIETALECAHDTRRTLEADLRRLYRYDVVSRNCVTEIFQTIDAALAAHHPEPQSQSSSSAAASSSLASSAARPAGAEQPLRGRVDGRAGLNFVPLVSKLAVERTYAVTDRTVHPSYRRYWLERLSTENGRLATRLRESNVVTSTLHHRIPGEDFFLFFTDDTIALRPLLGALNTLVGAGAIGAGFLALPFDGGGVLTTAARSLTFSVPEITFLSFRKGENPPLPYMWTAQP